MDEPHVLLKPVYENWGTQFGKNIALAKWCLWTNDWGLGVNNALIAAELQSSIDHTRTFKQHVHDAGLPQGLGEDASSGLKHINVMLLKRGVKPTM